MDPINSIIGVYKATYNIPEETTNICYDCGRKFTTRNRNQHYCYRCPQDIVAIKRESDIYGA